MHTGVAIHFWKVPILEYEPLGCYKAGTSVFMILMTVVSYFENFVPQEVTIEGESTLIPSLEGDLEVRFAINERMHTTAYNRM